MDYRVSLSARALRDLTAIYDFVGAVDSAAGRAWFELLEDAIYSLEHFPERGRRVPGKRNRRRLLFGVRPGVYKILYGVDRERGIVNIFHVRHGARS